MAERLNLAAPAQFVPPVNRVEIVAVHERRKPWHLHIELADENGRPYDFNYAGAEARTAILAGNTANNSLAGKSRVQRLLEWMQTRGDLGPGTFETVADPPV